MKLFLLILLVPLKIIAQNIPFSSFKKYPFPTELCASPNGNKIAWAFDEQGKRNVYAAESPDFKPRKLTEFTKDDGQELTSLAFSSDGNSVVFVRGGEHGSNWETELPVNPGGESKPFTVKIGVVPFLGGESKYVAEGDNFVIAPDNKTIAFIKESQVWIASLDSLNSSKNLFKTRGKVGSLAWSPDGSSLLFVADRGDHSIIGIFKNANTPIKWLSPSFTYDEAPEWSLDGKKVVFVRMPGAGGSPEPMLTKKHEPWAIWVSDIAENTATQIWKSPTTLKGSVPTTHGGFNLHWAAGNRIVFLSYKDGWPHIYSIASTGGKELLLTPGNYMCEHISLSSNKKYLTFSANTGPENLDLERRHVAKVSVDKMDLEILTPGSGLEWTPIMSGDGNYLTYISATAQRPPLPTIKSLGNDSKIKIIGLEIIPADFPESKLITPKQVIFTAADGIKIHADLFMPVGGSSKKAAIVYVHGGPPRQMLLGWHYSDYYSNAYASNQYLASLGFVVLSVNYRLGIGYGYDFHQPKGGGIRGASEYQDIKAAGEWLKKQSFVNVNKIGIYGGSYGGYLTAMALAKDSKTFAAGVDIHGVHDWGANASIMTAFQNKTQKAPDYEKAIQTAWSSSPVSSMATWKSPVLVIHADDDRNVRVNQSTDLIKRLDQYGIPYESILIVDDTHHWLNWVNAVKVYQSTADFFVRKFMK